MKKITLLLCLTLLTLSCGSDDDSGLGEPNASGNWNLIRVTGGFVGANSTFPQGLIRWNFQNGVLTIQNNNTSSEADLFPSGIYEYSIEESQGDYFLFIDNRDYGLIENNLLQLSVDGAIQLDGNCIDCFSFILTR